MRQAQLTDKQRIALKIVNLAKTQALVDNHFLSAAVGRLEVNMSASGRPLATNARELFVNADLLCEQFKVERDAPVRDLMHSVLHCIFLHPYVAPSVDRRFWNLACDIAAERNVANLCGPRSGQRGREIGKALTVIESDVKGIVTAEKLYQAFCVGQWTQHVDVWEAVFASDYHGVWYPEREKGEALAGGNQTQSGAISDKEGVEKPDSSSDSNSESSKSNKDSSSNERGNYDTGGQSAKGADNADGEVGNSQTNESNRGDGSASVSGDGMMPQQADSWLRNAPQQQDRRNAKQEKAEWRRVAKSLAVNLQTYARERGTHMGSFVDELEIAALEKVDYGDFLRQFAVMGEVMRLSDDEFDYVFYTYGLRLYGNMPLIEPLEFREEKRIRDFVIAIDTSESVYGAIVKRFIDVTFDILKSTEAFFEKVCVHIIQCDARVQSDDVVTSLDELKSWGETFELRGGGGTDFRPAFAYVDKLLEKGEFTNLNGLIYFTDGWGMYPEYVPEYKTAFVFYDNNYHPENVPPWAVQVVLDDMVINEAYKEAEREYSGGN